MPKYQSVAQQLMPQAKNLREFATLQEADEMERDATKRLYERFRREFGTDEAAKNELKRRGYDLKLLN